MPYPVSTAIEPQLADRNRLTTAFRLILAIPHLILVGGVGVGFAANSSRRDVLSFGGETGLLGSIALLLAIVSWFTIVITSEHYTPIRRYHALLPALAGARARLPDAAGRRVPAVRRRPVSRDADARRAGPGRAIA